MGNGGEDLMAQYWITIKEDITFLDKTIKGNCGSCHNTNKIILKTIYKYSDKYGFENKEQTERVGEWCKNCMKDNNYIYKKLKSTTEKEAIKEFKIIIAIDLL